MTDGGKLLLESGVPESIVEDLARRGHAVTITSGGFGGYQAIWIDNIEGGERVYRGATESRKDGCAVGW